jgi:hypothetical protein
MSSVLERCHDFHARSGLREVGLFLAKNRVGGILTGYTYRGTTPAYSLPAIRADGPGRRLNT